MGRRDTLISNSILEAIFKDKTDDKKTLLARIFAFFSVFQLTLSRYRDELFRRLRNEVWKIDEKEYTESFQGHGEKDALKAVGDLGYSGSTFFTTQNSKFMIKALPRPSEYSFFRDELLDPYSEHMTRHPESLLVRITDFLHAPYGGFGSIIGFAPSHHIIMENVMYGKETDTYRDKWETYDLKPASYFYPERDIAGGILAPASVKERLVDKFNDKVRITPQQRRDLLDVLSRDTLLLESRNVTDYSLFLIRYPRDHREITMHAARSSSWRTGIESTDHVWVYRAVLLDFFWAKHKLRAKAMTGLIKSFNVLARKGPMSITTDAKEYRTRFLAMVEEILTLPNPDLSGEETGANLK